VSVAVIVSFRVNISPSNIVIALDSRFSFPMLESPLLDDKPCFRINPEVVLIPELIVNVETPTLDATIKSPTLLLFVSSILNLLPTASP
jgi:hypothetical protein